MPATLLEFVHTLVEEGELLLAISSYEERSKNHNQFWRRYRQWYTNIVHALEYAKLDSHRSDVNNVLGQGWGEQSKIEYILGIVGSAYDLLSRGLVGNLTLLLHAEMFATTVEQAQALLKAGHALPAAVLARIVLEGGWLRDEAERAGIAIDDGTKASTINERLKEAGRFSTPKWRQVQAYLDVGNAAAHGKSESFTAEDVARFLAFEEVNCA